MSVVLGALEYEHDELGNLIKRRCLKKGLVKQYVDKDGYLKYHLGQTHEIYNMTQFCKDRGLHASHMMDVAKGKKFYRQYKGWTKP